MAVLIYLWQIIVYKLMTYKYEMCGHEGVTSINHVIVVIGPRQLICVTSTVPDR